MNTHAELSAMTNKELVAVHNGLAEQCGANDLKAWKGKKELLVDRILEMREQVVKTHPEPMWDDEPSGETVDADVETIAETSNDEQRETLEQSTRTIKAASVELLCHVDYHENRDAKPGTTTVEASDPKARSVGLAYDEIIRRVQEEFPGCSTSVACLRWYAVKIRVGEHGYEDLRLPQRRPRAKPKTAK